MGQCWCWCCDAAVGWEGGVSAWLSPVSEDFSVVFCCQAFHRGHWGGAEEGPGVAVLGGACVAQGGLAVATSTEHPCAHCWLWEWGAKFGLGP